MKSNTILLFKILLFNLFKWNRLKEKNSKYRINVILVGITVFILAIMLAGYSFGIGYSLDSVNMLQFTEFGELISKQIHSLYPLGGLFEKAVNDNSIGALLLFVVISVAWYWLFIKLLSLKYKSIHTAFMTHQTKSNYQIQTLKTSSALKALYTKELKRGDSNDSSLDGRMLYLVFISGHK